MLGSGGPIADDARASSGYLIWDDAKARVLVDIGSGALLRYAQSGADFRDLDALLLTHLHTDHSADLPGLLKSGVFSGRRRPVLIAGPGRGRGRQVSFPSLTEYLDAMFSPSFGAYAYLAGYLDGSQGLPRLRPVVIGEDSPQLSLGGKPPEVSPGAAAVTIDTGIDGLRVEALEVAHGPVPALAYRVSLAEHVVVFAGDQHEKGERFADFAQGARLLVLPMPIGVQGSDAALALHAPPQRLGVMAQRAGVQSVLLSHFMQRSLRNLNENIAAVRENYTGELWLAEDLDCYLLAPKS
ncbi:MAG: MBL fold metallo-hydrolase [Congregibacter sp.]